MDIAHQLLMLLHLIGFASLFGGLLVQARSGAPEVNSAMVHGSWTQLVSGLVLVGLLEMGSEPVNQIKVGVKLVVTVLIVVLVMANRRFDSIPKGLWAILTVLTLGNATIAVMWR